MAIEISVTNLIKHLNGKQSWLSKAQLIEAFGDKLRGKTLKAKEKEKEVSNVLVLAAVHITEKEGKYILKQYA